MFDSFDFSLLDDPEFKEDAVREELVAPLLNKLGYSSSGPHKIIRSRNLSHPFVYIGTRKNNVTIIPDYTLIVDDDHRWILDAKAPSEVIITGRNPEQAFSYAIHPDVRASRYALCNGHSLAVFDNNKVAPVLNVSLSKIDKQWDDVNRLLSPMAFLKPELLNYKPDFGLYLLKTGVMPNTSLNFIPMGIPMVAKYAEGQYTSSVNMKFGDEWLAASFDFSDVQFQQLVNAMPADKATRVREALTNFPYYLIFSDEVPEVCIEAKIGDSVVSNENEDFCPLIVERFFLYNT